MAMMPIPVASAPTVAATNAGEAVATVADLLAEAEGSRTAAGTRGRQLVLISDLQQGGHMEALQGHQWPANVLLDVSRSVEGVHAGSIEVVDADTVRGWTRGRYPVFFEADFSRAFTSYGTWTGAELTPGSDLKLKPS